MLATVPCRAELGPVLGSAELPRFMLDRMLAAAKKPGWVQTYFLRDYNQVLYQLCHTYLMIYLFLTQFSLYCTVYCTILLYTILYYTILYYTILYYTILYYNNYTLL
jgi:hypothetical protein